MATLVYVEEPGELTQQTLAFARGLGDPLHAVTAGVRVDVTGVEKVHHAEGDEFGSYAPAAIARALVELMKAQSPSAVVGSGTPRGNEVLARVAAITDLPLAANCVASTTGEPASVTRTRWGGSLLEEARIHGATLLVTVQPHAVTPEPTAGVTKADLNLGSVSRLGIYSTGAFSVDELRLGATYADVTQRSPFTGTAGAANCHGKTVAALAQQDGGLSNAAATLGYASVAALQDAITGFCGN